VRRRSVGRRGEEDKVVQVRRVLADDWARLRDVRLRALAASPEAFGSTLAREQLYSDEQWRVWQRSAAWFMAFDGERPVGLVGGRHDPVEWLLIAMWVAPEARGQGVGGRLVDAVVAEAVRQGASAVALHVTERNLVARKAYERFGFVATGEWEDLPREGDDRRERMRLPATGSTTNQ
jgi:ribosomal protein S18 acetylase RimI-like enzyme